VTPVIEWSYLSGESFLISCYCHGIKDVSWVPCYIVLDEWMTDLTLDFPSGRLPRPLYGWSCLELLFWEFHPLYTHRENYINLRKETQMCLSKILHWSSLINYPRCEQLIQRIGHMMTSYHKSSFHWVSMIYCWYQVILAWETSDRGISTWPSGTHLSR